MGAFEYEFSQFKETFSKTKQFETSNTLSSLFWKAFENENGIQEIRKIQDQERILNSYKILEAERIAAESARLSSFTPISPPMSPTCTPDLSREVSKSSSSAVGIYISRGCANGREVFKGPRGGFYYLNTSNNKQYVNAATVKLY